MTLKNNLALILLVTLFISVSCKQKEYNILCGRPNQSDIADSDSMEYNLVSIHRFTLLNADTNKLEHYVNNIVEYSTNNWITFYKDFRINVSDSVRALLDIKVNRWSFPIKDLDKSIVIGGHIFIAEYCHDNDSVGSKSSLTLTEYLKLPNSEQQVVVYSLDRIK